MKAQAKLEGPVHESFVLSHIRAANAQLSLHIRTVSSQPLLLELKKSDAEEGSGPTLSLLRQWFYCC